jgi:hypothetical protein
VLFSLTADRKLTDFQRVVQALIFSVLVKVAVDALSWVFIKVGTYWAVGQWSQDVEFAWSVVLAAIFGGVLAYLLKTDMLYSFLRSVGVTSQTSRPSVWYSCFCDHPETYVVLQFKDDRRIQGWPREWPSVVGEGHLRLDNAAWLAVNADGKQEVRELPSGSFVMVDVAEIKWSSFSRVMQIATKERKMVKNPPPRPGSPPQREIKEGVNSPPTYRRPEPPPPPPPPPPKR